MGPILNVRVMQQRVPLPWANARSATNRSGARCGLPRNRVYACIDIRRRELRYANAGHDRVILLRDNLKPCRKARKYRNLARTEPESRM